MTERSSKWLRARGCRVGKVEQWIPTSPNRGGSGFGCGGPGGIRRDLFGFVDLFVLDGIKPYGVQACAMSGRAAHLAKIAALEQETGAVSHWLSTGLGLWLHSWRKLKSKRGGMAVRWEVDLLSFTLDGGSIEVWGGVEPFGSFSALVEKVEPA